MTHSRLGVMDLVCAYCGSELEFVAVADAKLPDHCTNDECPYSEGGTVGAWTVGRDRLQLQLED